MSGTEKPEQVVITSMPFGVHHHLVGVRVGGSTVNLNQCICGEGAIWSRSEQVEPWDALVITCEGSGWEIASGRIEPQG